MATEFDDTGFAQVREVIHRLLSPIPDLQILLALLSAPLGSLGLLPPLFRRYNIDPLPPGAVNVTRHILPLQRALLEHVIPTWGISLAENNATSLVDQYFSPDTFSFALSAAGDVSLLAYSSILSQPLTEYTVRLLGRLSAEYPVDVSHHAAFSRNPNDISFRQVLSWETYVRNITTVPAKVANALGGKGNIPPLLEHGTYFNNLSLRCETLISSLSNNPSKDIVCSITYLLTKLVNIGAFPPTPPTSRSQPSFFQVTLRSIRARLAEGNPNVYSEFWYEIIRSLPSASTLQAILASLLASLSEGVSPPYQRVQVKQEAWLLLGIIGAIRAQDLELWECISALILGRDWSEYHSRIFVCWIAGPIPEHVNEEGLDILLAKIVEMWSSPEHVKHSLLARHRYLTSLLLVTVSYFPPSSSQIQSLSVSPAFISGVGLYVGHLDDSVRRCGMLAAEVVAQYAGRNLDFGDWDGDAAGKSWAREIRQLLKARDIDADFDISVGTTQSVPSIAETSTAGVRQNDVTESPQTKVILSKETDSDSDDSLTGYASSSSRSTSPTPTELAEIEQDPTLRVGLRKLARPVYLAQLGEMVRGTGGLRTDSDNQDADKVEMALNCAEELIRKKKNYGTELDENAVNLVYGLVGLQDNYDLDGFEAKRQGAVNALVACCPRKAASSLIEEFFKNQYSTNQRYVILNALAFGARELSSLPSPSSALSPTPQGRISFPSKVLPSPLHYKYSGDQHDDTIQGIVDVLSRNAIDRDKDAHADKVPVRERQLRIRKPAQITELIKPKQTHMKLDKPMPSGTTTFTEVAAEFFIVPLINQFWLFLRDEQTREERTAHYEGRQRYNGAGTGLILNPLILTRFLGTLAILVHAAQNSPEWLAVVAPGALELAVTLGTRPVSQMNDDDEISSGRTQAAVVSTALELALIVLDGCGELDGGRALGLNHTALLLGAGEWASAVFARLERGVRLEGGGGAHEIRLRRSAAGVLLKVDDLTSRWRRSMVDTR